jgi:hypothetical protein
MCSVLLPPGVYPIAVNKYNNNNSPISNFKKICFSDLQFHLCSLCFQKLSVLLRWRQYFKHTVLGRRGGGGFEVYCHNKKKSSKLKFIYLNNSYVLFLKKNENKKFWFAFHVRYVCDWHEPALNLLNKLCCSFDITNLYRYSTGNFADSKLENVHKFHALYVKNIKHT